MGMGYDTSATVALIALIVAGLVLLTFVFIRKSKKDMIR
jgi:LPXTG-motif cell wall-anchored protein